MRICEQSPIGRERIEDIVARQRAIDAVMQELVRRHDAARDVVVVLVVAAHQIKIGRRQHGERNACVREPLRHPPRTPASAGSPPW